MSIKAGNSPQSSFSKKVLNVGFCAGLVLAFLALVACFAFLGVFLYKTTSNIENGANSPDHAAAMTRLGLQGCGVMAGIAFGFLGFSLFLLCVRGEMDLAVEHRDWKMTLSHLAPGSLVLLASCMLVYFCVSYAIPEHLVPKTSPVGSETKK